MSKKIKFVIEMDENLRDRIKHQSIRDKKPMGQICRELIEEYLEQKENEYKNRG